MSAPEHATPRQTTAGGPRSVKASQPSDDDATHLVPVLGVRHPVAVSGGRDARIAAIAGLQRGRISRTQLLAAGVRDRTIYFLVAAGRLHREHRSVYTVGHSAPIPLAAETSALLACGEHAMLSHYSAALLWKLIPHGDGLIHVTIPARHGPSPRGVRVHRTSSLTPGDIQIHDGLPVTSAARAVLDLASIADIATLERATEEAITQRLVGEAGLRAIAASATGHRGASRLTAFLDAMHEPGVTKSKAERRFRRLLRAAQLPQPLTNARVNGYSVDCYWPELGVVIEVQGYKFHSGRGAFERDTRKAAKLAAAGITTAYVTWLQMEHEAFAVVARVAQTLARRAT